MGWRNGSYIILLFICSLFICCNSGDDKTARGGSDSLNITAGAAIISNNVVSCLSNSKEFSTFIDLLKESGLDETLKKPGPFTVFAPTNKAFQKLSVDTIQKWRNANSQDLLNFLSN